MYDAPRSSQAFVNGVQTFLKFAFERTCVDGGMIKCLCTNCLNMKYQSKQSVLDHLICSGFRPEYLKWVYHGEGATFASTSTSFNEEEEISHHDMQEMLNDIFEPGGRSGVEVHENDSNNSQETNNNDRMFDDLVKEVEVKVYTNCKYNKKVKFGGPIVLRWMYPTERNLLKLKSHVHNRAHPEGSIAEGYLTEESITFFSRYLSKVETVFTREIRNDDEGHQNHIEESNNLCPGRALGHKLDLGVYIHKRKRSSNSEIEEKSLSQAHRYVLFNVEVVTPFREEHKQIVKGHYRGCRMPDFEMNKIHAQQFADWFKRRIARMEEQGDEVGPYSNDCTFDVPSLHRIGDDGEDGIDITPDMERGEDVEENDEDSILF
ncbi:hypothetical protein QVD17_12172 [Tagetes erecta]|uniref:Transposase-associated domain-containing protein n=1 Tax=Tagetes erecta TaxID=13708 RepID=A0AAD8KZ96_TARER|nr:hypothetical protein QVD17_12172 [Tagetes erecta]